MWGKLEPGSDFAGYTIERELAAGGMGVIYLAKHPRLPRTEVLKLLSVTMASESSAEQRFIHEMNLVAKLTHPNILAIHDCGNFNGQPWFSMPYVVGSDAAAETVNRTDGLPTVGMTPGRAVHVVERVGRALDYAHEQGVIHRDVKPANVLLTARAKNGEPEAVFLTDFGIAKALDSGPGLTATGAIVLTVEYASPEQICGEELDGRSDLYSLGCLLYALLTGAIPYPGDRSASIAGHLSGPPPRPSLVDPALPIAFDAVIAKAMAKRPGDRFGSASELAEAAATALESQTAVTQIQDPSSRVTILERSEPGRHLLPDQQMARRSRRPLGLVVGGLAIVIIAAAVLWLMTSRNTNTQAGTPTSSQTSDSAGVSENPDAVAASAAATPLTDLMNPAPERKPGEINGVSLASEPSFAMQPKNCERGRQQITVDLNGNYSKVTGNLQLDDAAPASAFTSFTAEADGADLDDKMLKPTEGYSFDLDVRNANSLILTLAAAGQGSCTSDYRVFLTSALAYP